jgi:hypothetical protein
VRVCVVVQELVPGFIVNGTDAGGAVFTANLFLVGSVSGSAYGFTASVGLQMCLLAGAADVQCFPNPPELLFSQSERGSCGLHLRLFLFCCCALVNSECTVCVQCVSTVQHV